MLHVRAGKVDVDFKTRCATMQAKVQKLVQKFLDTKGSAGGLRHTDHFHCVHQAHQNCHFICLVLVGHLVITDAVMGVELEKIFDRSFCLEDYVSVTKYTDAHVILIDRFSDASRLNVV